MINAELASAFSRIADLLEISGESAFRVNSYHRVARFLKSYTSDIAQVAKVGALTDLPGIGKGTAEKIQQYVETSRIDLLDELESKLPAGLPDLLRIPGFGPKKVAAAHDKLDVKSLDDLKDAIESGALAELPGFGAQSVKRIAEGITFLEHSGNRTPLGVALPVAEQMSAWIADLRGVKRVELAGSLRRGCETIGDVDLLCQCADGERIVEAFTTQPKVKRVLASGKTKGSITVDVGRELQIDLRVVPAESFGAALQYFTGSKEHNVGLREIAVRKKLRLNEYGLYQGEKSIAGRTEESIYNKLGVACVPPEVREDTGELDLAETPSLVGVGDIRGDLHMHTHASDGKSTLDEMIAAARDRGYDYIAITDHSKSSTIANGLSVERMERQIETVREADKLTKDFRVLVGCECDILPNGKMDYPDEILAECDVVVASIHSAMGGGKVSPTKRLIAAIENPYVSIIGHATARLLGKRPAMDVDMAAVVKAAAANHTAMEINSAWQRLDLNAIHAKQAIEAGVMLVINTDSHHVDGLANIRLGVTTARRAWASPEHILNTRSTRSLISWLGKKRP